MIDRLISFSIRNRFLVVALSVLAAAAGLWAMYRVPLDAIPDLSDTQVIVYTKWPGQPPNLIEDQVTYPIVSTFTAAPRVKDVRGVSQMGASYVYVIFEDGTDIYWARSRVLEYLQGLAGSLPDDAKVSIGPDATAVGWVYEYALLDRTGRHDLAELRTLQDWYIRFILQAVPGVAEVATVGGFEKQYVVEIDPERTAARGVTLPQVLAAIRASNRDVGGRTIEWAGREYLVWGSGYVTDPADLEKAAVGATREGVPIRLADVARVTLAPNIRRGAADLDGEGEVVGAIVSMRFGENALRLIERIEKTIEEDVRPMLPEGVEIVTTYDRSSLIQRAIDNLKKTLFEEIVVVAIVIAVFLFHLRASFVPAVTLPIACLVAFVPMLAMKITANIMSLGGIAISIGVIVDAAVVMVENAYRRVREAQTSGGDFDRAAVIETACKQVGRPIFFSLVIIVLSFLPVFLLEGQEGRLFRPLAWTKTLTLAASSFLAVTLIPALLPSFLRGRLRSEEEIPPARFFGALYAPVVGWALRRRKTTVAIALAATLAALPLGLSLGSEFMPPLREGSLLYMPVTFPGVSVTEAVRILQAQDKAIRAVPEVERVFGKVGRSESSLDPAPLAMVETVILLKDESEWRPGMTWEKLVAELDEKVRFPGWQNAWTMPIRTRIDMLTTGIRTPVGVKVMGGDLREVERIAKRIEAVANEVPGTRSAFAERVMGGTFLKITPNRDALARYGLSVEDAQRFVSMALGGMPVGRTVEGRERYTIALRYPRELRTDLAGIERMIVPLPARREGGEPTLALGRSASRGPASTHAGMTMERNAGMGDLVSFHPASIGGEVAHVPLGELAKIEKISAPQAIRDENGLLTAYVFVDVAGRDLGGYVTDLKRAIDEKVRPHMPPGMTLKYSGQYEFKERAAKHLSLIVPAVVLAIFLLLVITFRSVPEALLVLLAVPSALAGGAYLQWFLGWNWSVAVWVGYIALFGIAVETGVVMVIYLQEAVNEKIAARGADLTEADLAAACYDGAAKRLRPKLMTVGTTLLGITPILWSTGTGADVMKPIATPLIGGVVSSTVAILVVLPVLFYWHARFLLRRGRLTVREVSH